MMLATPHQPRHNAPVPFNSGAGLGGLNKKADSRLMRHFLCPLHTIGASFSMSGRGGRTFGFAGSFLPVRQSCYVLGTPLGGEGSSLTLKKEATMPSITRALSRHFPIVKTLAFAVTLAEAQAIARLHLGRTGRSVCVQPDASGFQIVEVR
ncbi:hypothetical protein [Paludibacterium denitrificans]|uniref:Uncharacterized protein n=1 Tax=Paludibacterium denitrificans TaxID=2675226 RepID=A0A844GE02_9NEIS|nr:hypothetical protein [Paludibacterium denitrificans]MTD33448.1 hypothetical protein [Paludibacterium denitrificans]